MNVVIFIYNLIFGVFVCALISGEKPPVNKISVMLSAQPKRINKKVFISQIPYEHSIWSRWQDLNLRSPAPKAGAIAKLRYTSMILNYYMIMAVKVALVALLQNRRTVRLRSHCSFCCASSSSLHLPQAALAFVTQSRCDSQTSLHLDAFYCPVILI